MREAALQKSSVRASLRADRAVYVASEPLIPRWYRARLRPLLCVHAVDLAAQLDGLMSRACPGEGRTTELRVGIIGEAGVGKSSLINALLSQRLPILPQGGVGPLTATPIEIRHSADPYLRVTCLGSSRVRQLIDAVATNSLAPQLVPGNRVVLRALRQLARLLVCDSQFAELDPPTLLAFLFSCLSREMDDRIPSHMFERLMAAQSVIECGDSPYPVVEVSAGLDLPELLATLGTHAAGCLAPLTSSLELGWDAESLRDNIVLVDLPGLGVANDQYQRQTSAALVELDALLLVVDRSGLTQASADLLRSTRFLQRMIDEGSSRRPATLELLVAVTKLDQPVADAVLVAKQSGAASVNWASAASACAERAREVLKSQLDLEIADLVQAGDEAAGRRVSERLTVFPVFPREYQRLHRADPEEPTPLREAAGSGILKLSARLSQIGRAHNTDLLVACRRAVTSLKGGPANDEAERLKLELRDLVAPPAGSKTT